MLAVGAGVAALATLSACGGPSTTGSSGGSSSSSSGTSAAAAKTYNVAFLAASSENGYNQAVYQGIKQEAAKLGHVNVTIFNGNFDAQTQYNQMQTAGSDGKYQGIVVVPQDNVSLAAAVKTAYNNHVPVTTALFPIGPNLNQLTPQVPGVVSTEAAPAKDAAVKQAQEVVSYCQSKNPCQVFVIVGSLSAPYDHLRDQAYMSVLNQHSNIKVVATLQGEYDRNTSLTAVQDALQAHPHPDAILSNADQQTEGAQIALQNAGIDPSSIYLTGGGGTTEAVAAVRSGKWKTDYLNFPVTQGNQAMQQLYNAMTGKKVTAVLNSDTTAPFNPYADKAILDAHPNFKGQWSG